MTVKLRLPPSSRKIKAIPATDIDIPAVVVRYDLLHSVSEHLGHVMAKIQVHSVVLILTIRRRFIPSPAVSVIANCMDLAFWFVFPLTP